jgi:glycosyltransferase involved in cell wall biosynthesis
MKVLHVAPSIEQSYGGPTKSLAAYLSASVKAGVEAHVAAPESIPADLNYLEHAGAASVITFESSGRGGLARSPSLVKWLDKRARVFDVIHVHGLFNFISSMSSRSAVAADSALVIRPFGTLSRYTFTHRRGLLKRTWFRILEKPSLLGASGIHFTTAMERDEADWHGLPLAAKSYVVPPAYVHDAAGPPVSPAERDTVLFVGRLHPIKNLEALLDAWPSVLRSHPLMRLVIAGSGEADYERALHERAHANGVSGSVSFAGFLTARQRELALSKAALFVLPSFHENFGMAALEAIAAGVPVVFSPHVQLGDFVSENNLGVVTDSSPALLAKGISETLSDRQLRERVSERGRGIVDECYSSETIGLKLRTMYLAVLEYHRKRTQI